MKISDYNTIVCDSSSAAISYAAGELVKYVKKCCGKELTVNAAENDKAFVLVCGRIPEELKERCRAEALKYEGFYIVCKNKKIYIISKSEKGVIFGVYDFLERYLGVRFYNEGCEIIPENFSAYIPDGEILCNPLSEQRIYLSEKSGCNPRLDLKYRFSSDFVLDDKLLDIRSQWCNEVSDAHNSLDYVPMDKYGATHPEFYFLNKKSGIYELCYTNGIDSDGRIEKNKESVAKAVVDSMEVLMEKSPAGVRYFMFGRQDDGLALCDCPQCVAARKKYKGEAGTMIVFLNAVIAELRRRFDEKGKIFDKYIVTFAYSSTVSPPVDSNFQPIDSKVVPDRNLCIRCAFLNADYTYPLSDDRQNPEIKFQFKGWKALTENIMIWDYAANFSESFWYYPNLEYIGENIRNYTESGVNYIMNQGAYNIFGSWQDDMKAYICSRLYWDCRLNVKELITEYLQAYYGAAWKNVYDYIDKTEKFFADRKNDGMKTGVFGQYDILCYKNYTLDFLEDGLSILDGGIDALKQSERHGRKNREYMDRLDLVRLTPLRMIILNADFYGEEVFDRHIDDYENIIDRFELPRTGESGYTQVYLAEVGTFRYFSDYRIVLSQNPTEEERRAAALMRERIFSETGVLLPIIDDSEIYPTNTEKGIMIGNNAMVREFFKEGILVDDYEYYFDAMGYCLFILSTKDIVKACETYLDKMTLRTARGLKVRPYRRFKRNITG